MTRGEVYAAFAAGHFLNDIFCSLGDMRVRCCVCESNGTDLSLGDRYDVPPLASKEGARRLNSHFRDLSGRSAHPLWSWLTG